MSYREALEALKMGEYRDVIAWFEALPAEQRDGKTCALAGLAHFKLEEYERRREALRRGGIGRRHGQRAPRVAGNAQPCEGQPRRQDQRSKCPNRITSRMTTCWGLPLCATVTWPVRRTDPHCTAAAAA